MIRTCVVLKVGSGEQVVGEMMKEGSVVQLWTACMEAPGFESQRRRIGAKIG